MDKAFFTEFDKKSTKDKNDYLALFFKMYELNKYAYDNNISPLVFREILVITSFIDKRSALHMGMTEQELEEFDNQAIQRFKEILPGDE